MHLDNCKRPIGAKNIFWLQNMRSKKTIQKTLKNIETMKVKDIFKNNIEVTNLKDAIKQTEMFLSWSEENPNTFGEYKLIPATDSHGKSTTISRKIENGKEVTNIEFYSHLLKQLQKLKN